MTTKNMTDLELAGVAFPPGSDRGISVSSSFIGSAADIQRTVNGEAVDMARASFKKRAFSISCTDFRAAGLDQINPGAYIEAIMPEPLSVTLPVPAATAMVPGSVDVFAFTADGRRIKPTAQPADQRPLSNVKSSARIAALRALYSVEFEEAVETIHYRPILPCIVMSATGSSDEMSASTTWTLTLEEI